MSSRWQGSRMGADVVAVKALAAVVVASLLPVLNGAGAASQASVPAPSASASAPAGNADVRATFLLDSPGGGARRGLRHLLAHPASSPSVSRRVLEQTVPPLQSVRRVEAWARGRGLTVVRHGRWTVTVSGSAEAMSKSFVVRLRQVRRVGRDDVFATRPPGVPAALRSAASAVVGLDTRPVFTHAAVTAQGYVGSELRRAYAMSRAGSTGASVTVGLVQFSAWDSSDLTTFAAGSGIPLAPGQVTTISDGTQDAETAASGGAVEAALDSEAVLAVAPQARQRVYVTANDIADAVALYDQMARDAAAGLFQVASTSWGVCEPSLTSDQLAALHEAIGRIGAGGATMFAASGDAGSSCGTSPPSAPLVSYPASDPSVVAVGGTNLAEGSDGSFAETAWSLSLDGRGDYVGSGGGVSAAFPRPAYQAALPSSLGSGRLVPDIAAVADPATGFAMYERAAGGWITAGGTSLAAPVEAAGLAGALSSSGLASGLGDIHDTLYRAPPGAFRDITQGSNGLYSAAPGYDLVTGLGSGLWSPLAAALGLPSAPDVPPPPAPDQPAATAGDRSATVTWAPVADPGVAGYVVVASPGGVRVSVGASASSVVVPDLQPGKAYTFTVASVNAAGASAPSPASAAVTPTAAPTAAGVINNAIGAQPQPGGLCAYLNPHPSFPQPEDMTFGPDGALYAIDEHSVARIDLATDDITTVAGTCQTTWSDPSGDGGPATEASLGDPSAIAFDSAGNLYIGSGGYTPATVRRVDARTGTISLYAGSAPAVPGVQPGAWQGDPDVGNGGPADQADLQGVSDLAFGPDGDLYIADRTGVRRVDRSTGLISQFAGGGNVAMSTLGDGGPATAARLNPVALAFAANGDLYITDSANANEDMVRMVPAGTGTIQTVVGSLQQGVPGLADGDGGPATSASLYYPHQLAIDGNGRVLIVDDARARIRRFDPNTGSI